MKQLRLTKQNVWMFSISLIILSFLFIVVFPFFGANADADSLPQTMLDFINEGMIKEVSDILIDSEFFDVATEEGSTGYVVANALKAVGMGIVTLMAYVKMITEVNRGHNPVESFIKALIETCAAALVILYLDDALKGLDDLGSGIMDKIVSEDTLSEQNKLTLAKLTGKTDGGIVWWIQSVCLLFFPWICSLFLVAAAKIVSYSMILELAIRRAFAPLAIGDIAGEGLRSPGMRYFKKYLAVYLKMAICIVICMLISSFMVVVNETNELGSNSDLFAGFNFMLNNIALNVTALGLMFKTGEFANDIVGA